MSPGLLYKLRQFLSPTYFLIIRSYLTERTFKVNHNSAYSSLFSQSAGVPQGNILGPILYTVYTADIPTHPSTVLTTYADDTCVLSVNNDPSATSQTLQSHIKDIEQWCKKWRIKINPIKSLLPFVVNPLHPVLQFSLIIFHLHLSNRSAT